jgi:hypothetical protein
MTTQVCYATTAFGLATVVAALADEALPAADRRVLVLSNNAAIPEVAYGVADVAGTGTLVKAFDDVYSYNDAIAPQHPAVWQPRDIDRPIWERSLRALWGLEGDVHLVVESIQVDPALALCQTLADANLDVYAEGLMSYGPTRNALPDQVGVRVRRVLYPDLVPGVVPLLLREYGAEPVLLSTESFQKALAAMAADAGPIGLPTSGERTAVLLGQYLSALRLLSTDEELRLYLQMVEETVAEGYTDLVFKAHPGASAGLTAPLAARAQQLGARLTIRTGPELVETWYAAGAVDLVVGCFSTALATAGLYGVPAARVGTELMLERLKPYENSNRIPATVVAATIPPLTGLGTTSPPRPEVPLDQLVKTVGYLMQPSRNPDLRPGAVALLRQRPDELRPYVERLRLTQLDLPGGQEPGPAARLGRAGTMVKRVLGPRLSRRVGTLARRLLRR